MSDNDIIIGDQTFQLFEKILNDPEDDIEIVLSESGADYDELIHFIEDNYNFAHNKEVETLLSDLYQKRATKRINREKEYVNIGIVGNSEAEGATLTSAIFAVLSKRRLLTKEYPNFDDNMEKTADLAPYAKSESTTRNYFKIDYPKNEHPARDIVIAFSQIDGAIIEVDATAPIDQKVREQILIARQVNIPRLVIFMNNVHLIKDQELLELMELELRELLTFHEFDGDNSPVIQGYAEGALNRDPYWEEKINELTDACDAWIPLPPRDVDKPFLMPVEDVFSITGRGIIVTGRIETGMIRTGDELQLIGLGEKERKTVCTGVEMFRKILDYAQAGDNVGLLLRGIDKEEIKRGQVLAKPGSITSHTKFKAEVYVLKKEDGGRHTPFLDKYRPQFYLRTLDVTGEVSLGKGSEMVMPGDNATITVDLIHPVALNIGLRFAIRESGQTIGAGKIIEILD